MVNETNNPYAPGSSPNLPLSDGTTYFSGRSFLSSLLVMIPWPLLGIAGCMGVAVLERSSEMLFMFGGVTLLFLLPLAFIVTAEWIYGVLIAIVWLVVLLLPSFRRRNSVQPRIKLTNILIGQSIFSAIQAGLGFLMIIGKGV